MAKVYIKFNSAIIKEVTLTKDETTIGRKPTNDIMIDHPTVSGFHGKIRKDGDHYVIEDLNSTNGTFINGRRVKSGQIKNNDQIGIAGHILDFHSDNESTAAAVEKNPLAGLSDKEIIEHQKKILRQSLGLDANGKPVAEGPAPTAATGDVTGTIRIIAGGANGQTEIQIKDLVTYIGTTEKALIKIKGFLAPDLAAAISKRPDGFFLKAIKPGYPKVNGVAVNEQVLLENGASIEVAGTNMVFYRSDAKKAE